MIYPKFSQRYLGAIVFFLILTLAAVGSLFLIYLYNERHTPILFNESIETANNTGRGLGTALAIASEPIDLVITNLVGVESRRFKVYSKLSNMAENSRTNSKSNSNNKFNMTADKNNINKQMIEKAADTDFLYSSINNISINNNNNTNNKKQLLYRGTQLHTIAALPYRDRRKVLKDTTSTSSKGNFPHRPIAIHNAKPEYRGNNYSEQLNVNMLISTVSAEMLQHQHPQYADRHNYDTIYIDDYEHGSLINNAPEKQSQKEQRLIESKYFTDDEDESFLNTKISDIGYFDVIINNYNNNKKKISKSKQLLQAVAAETTIKTNGLHSLVTSTVSTATAPGISTANDLTKKANSNSNLKSVRPQMFDNDLDALYDNSHYEILAAEKDDALRRPANIDDVDIDNSQIDSEFADDDDEDELFAGSGSGNGVTDDIDFGYDFDSSGISSSISGSKNYAVNKQLRLKLGKQQKQRQQQIERKRSCFLTHRHKTLRSKSNVDAFIIFGTYLINSDVASSKNAYNKNLNTLETAKFIKRMNNKTFQTDRRPQPQENNIGMTDNDSTDSTTLLSGTFAVKKKKPKSQQIQQEQQQEIKRPKYKYMNAHLRPIQHKRPQKQRQQSASQQIKQKLQHQHQKENSLPHTIDSFYNFSHALASNMSVPQFFLDDERFFVNNFSQRQQHSELLPNDANTITSTATTISNTSTTASMFAPTFAVLYQNYNNKSSNNKVLIRTNTIFAKETAASRIIAHNLNRSGTTLNDNAHNNYNNNNNNILPIYNIELINSHNNNSNNNHNKTNNTIDFVVDSGAGVRRNFSINSAASFETRTRRLMGNVKKSEERSRQLLLCEEAGGGELCRMLFKGHLNKRK